MARDAMETGEGVGPAARRAQDVGQAGPRAQREEARRSSQPFTDRPRSAPHVRRRRDPASSEWGGPSRSRSRRSRRAGARWSATQIADHCEPLGFEEGETHRARHVHGVGDTADAHEWTDPAPHQRGVGPRDRAGTHGAWPHGTVVGQGSTLGARPRTAGHLRMTWVVGSELARGATAAVSRAAQPGTVVKTLTRDLPAIVLALEAAGIRAATAAGLPAPALLAAALDADSADAHIRVRRGARTCEAL